MMTAVPFGFAGRYGTNVGLETSRVMVMLLTSIVFSSQVQFSDPGAGPLYRGIGFSWAFAVIARTKNKNVIKDLFMVVFYFLKPIFSLINIATECTETQNNS